MSKNNISKLNEAIESEIPNYFTTEELEELARESEFVQRKGKIDGSTFIRLVALNTENLRKESLNDLTITLRREYDIDIAKQSLHERFNDKAVLFLKLSLAKLLQDRVSTEKILPFAPKFNRILIKDSVCFQVDESLAEYYPGSGGSASKAAVRIQFEYDLLGGVINDLAIHAFTDQDATNSTATMETVQEGDLIIRDLAYMHLDALGGFIEKGASFLCRLNTKTKVYQEVNGELKEVKFHLIVKRMREYKINKIDEDVYIGINEMLPVRLFIYLIPQEEYARRIRKANENAKKKGYTLSKEFKARAALNLFITNVTDGSLTLENAWALYRLRWQIELMFKVWKSIWEIDEVKKVKKPRFECYIISKLLIIVLCWQLVWTTAKALLLLEGKALSFMKAFKTLKRYVRDLKFFFDGNQLGLSRFCREFYEISKKKHLLEKKRLQERSLDLLAQSLMLMEDNRQEACMN